MIEDSLAGYKRLRHISGDVDSRLFLARKEDGATEKSDGQLWALTCFTGEAAGVAALTEAECRDQARGDHIVGIDDVASARDGTPILVHRWSQAGTLRRLLRERHSLRIGEAISIVAPLVLALRRAHDAAVTIGGIAIDGVEFDQRGAPVFIDFSRARRVSASTPAQLSACSEVLEDRRRLFSLCSSVFAAVSSDRDGERRRRELDEWLGAEESVRSTTWDHDLEQKLFALGAPEPIQLSTAGAHELGVQGAVVETTSHLQIAGSRSALNIARDVPAERGAELTVAKEHFRAIEQSTTLPRWISTQLRDWCSIIAQRTDTLKHRAAHWIAPVRPRTRVVALLGLAALCLALGLSLVPNADDQSGPVGETSVVGTAQDEPESRLLTAELRLLQGSPENALPILLTTRDSCLRDLSVECLEGVASSHSPAYSQDAALIAAVLAGAELDETVLFDIDQAVEVQRLGDSVLFDFDSSTYSKPASLLLVKGEAGWRIRSYSPPEE